MNNLLKVSEKKSLSLVNNENFYKDLIPFDNFNDLSREKIYTDAPSDWYLILTDVKNSTQAILNGQYKNVNIIGAACISAVENVVKTDFPSIFGGDGCSILIPPHYLENVKKSLSEIRNSSKDKFKLDLRVCIIPVSDLINLGQKIKIAKFKLSHNKNVAKFAGGGLAYAEKLMKQTTKYEMEKICEEYSEFKNLSCRWLPIPNQNGKIVTLIIQANKFEDYSQLLDELTVILGKDQKKINPVKTETMNYKNFWSMIHDEKFFEKSAYSVKSVLRFLEIIFCYVMFNKFRKYLPSFLKYYVKGMERHSDFRKFDDTLRMVVDCHPEQILLIEKLCDKFHIENKIFYGIHTSEDALMTCLVNNLNDGGHIHFIDGDKGGYALAAKKMKDQKTL